MHALRKYLRDWAEPEIGFAASVPEAYDRALVVPACREEASLLGGFTAAAETSLGCTLCILVVNGRENAPAEHHEHDLRLLEAVRGKLECVRELREGSSVGRSPGAFLGTLVKGRLDVLVVDRASVGARLPPREGVGLARKIGFDLALALHAEGRLTSRLIFGTDADATLPPAFFDQAAPSDSRTSAVTFAFWHTEAQDPRITEATAFYELSLRYYVEGLAWAGSPYAFHTVGSAMGVVADAYAAVRGMPRREAAEDFYLLNKLAKVGKVVHVPGSVVQIASRASDRTPFGTGASVRLALDSQERTLYSPDCFRVLRGVLGRLDAFAVHGDVDQFFSDLVDLPPDERRVVAAVLEQGGARAALSGAAAQASTKGARMHRVNAWFDAFRTLKLIHAVQGGVSANVPWKEAILEAPFLDGTKVGEGSASELIPVNERADETAFLTLRARMARAEAERGMRARPRA